MVYVDGTGLPIAIEVESAQKAEVKLALQTIDQVSIAGRPLHPRKRGETLCADKAYDAKWLRDALKARTIKPKIPKKRKKGQKDEPLRWERDDEVYEAFVTIACMLICLKKVLL